MNENPTQGRTPAGVPSGGQFAATTHGEARVDLVTGPTTGPTSGLEVEFARDEADQAVAALSNHETILVRDQRSDVARAALAANHQALRQMLALRDYLRDQRFAATRLSPGQVRAIGDALEFHREHVATAARVTGARAARAALDATDAALFRVDIARADEPGATPQPGEGR